MSARRRNGPILTAFVCAPSASLSRRPPGPTGRRHKLRSTVLVGRTGISARSTGPVKLNVCFGAHWATHSKGCSWPKAASRGRLVTTRDLALAHRSDQARQDAGPRISIKRGQLWQPPSPWGSDLLAASPPICSGVMSRPSWPRHDTLPFDLRLPDATAYRRPWGFPSPSARNWLGSWLS